MGKYNISSISLDENTGSARITIDGYIPVPDGCDDPLVELFRPVRKNYFDENLFAPTEKDEGIFFTILATHKTDCVICTLVPSNRRGRKLKDFLSTAMTALKGGVNHSGIITDYQRVIERFFYDEDGLIFYLDIVKNIEKASDTDRAALCNICDESIKKFVAKIGLTMPSRKRKPPKSKEEKKLSSKKYLEEHPEILKNKKPAK